MKQTPSRTRTLRWRINLILATGTGVAAIVATLLISNILVDQLKKGLEQKSKAVGTLLAGNLAAAVEFDDKDAALETIAALKQDSEFRYALVATKNAPEFAVYGKKPKGIHLELFGGDKHKTFEQFGMIHVNHPIARDKELLGYLQLGFSLDDILERSFGIRVNGMILCTILILALTLYFAYAMDRTIVRPISQMTDFIQKIGKGDLRQHALSNRRGKDTLEIELMREAVESTALSFRKNVQSIKSASDDLAGIANHILTSSSKLSNTASQQVDRVFEAFTTANKLETTGEETAGSAKEISNAAETSVTVSGEGLEVINDTLNQFHNVRDQVQTIVDAADDLNALLSHIDAIVVSVADVARQSQLLAVNASVEAAKAGTAGLRFAVVAKQVKELALQSKDATNTVRQTLSNVKNGIKNIADVSEDGRRRASDGLNLIEDGGKVIARLADVINNTANAARQISTNSDDQVIGLKEMSSAMFQIDDLSKSNLVAVQTITEFGQSLNNKANKMEELVSQFRIK